MVILASGRLSSGAASGISIPDSGKLMAECLEGCLLVPKGACKAVSGGG